MLIRCCDACEKTEHEAKLLISMNTVKGIFICNECVDICVEIITNRHAKDIAETTEV